MPGTQESLQPVRDSEPTKSGGFVIDFDAVARMGRMSKEESRIAKWHGVCGQHQSGSHFVRVVLPGGLLSTFQARALAAIARRYAAGIVSLTTRQAVQLHGIGLEALPNIQRELAASGLSTFHGCGDVTRNVTACPLADICSHRVFGVLGDVTRTAQALSGQRDLDDLPRKFKINFNGCSGNCSLPYLNDVGITAVRTTNHGRLEEGFAMVIGGGHGRRPAVAQPLFDFIPRSKIADVCRAVALLFKEHGDRTNRAKARLKYVVARLGIDRCRAIVEENLELEGVERHDILAQASVETSEPPPRFLASDALVGTDELAIQRVRVSRGEVRSEQLLRLAELAETHGDKYLRVNHRQNLEIHGVRRDGVAALRAEIRELGLGATGCFGVSDIVTCVGAKHCHFAATRTHGLAAAFDFLEEPEFDDIRARVMIDITGCPNACSPYRTADIGLRGARLLTTHGSTEGYEVAIGGDQRRLGVSLGVYRAHDCTRVVRALLGTYRQLMLPHEAFTDTVNRVGVATFQDAILADGIRVELRESPRDSIAHAAAAG